MTNVNGEMPGNREDMDIEMDEVLVSRGVVSLVREVVLMIGRFGALDRGKLGSVMVEILPLGKVVVSTVTIVV